MKRFASFVFVVSVAVSIGACCGKKADSTAPDPAGTLKSNATAAPTPTTTTTARACSAMNTIGDCTACCGTGHRAAFRGVGTCTCTKL